MPELPEVETIARSLRPLIQGKVVDGVDLVFRPLLRAKSARVLAGIAGRKVGGIRRRGKMLLVAFEAGPALVFHLKMTGQFLWVDRVEPRDKHTRLVLSFRGEERELRFRDVRKFGFLICHEGPALDSCPEVAALGPEPLEIGLPEFAARLAKRSGRIKPLLLNQTFIAGIGNIYADELLFEAGIHPRSEASALSKNDVRKIWEAMRSILSKAIAAKGTTLRDYTDAEGRIGEFQLEHKVYGREGEGCVGCGTVVRRIVLGGRSTFFCPRCQKRRRPRRPRKI
jgi:formamidopyrimidine-DNA glycosylase